MDHQEQILQELREISPVLAGIGKTTAYTLPEGYFEGLPAILLEKIQEASVSLPAPSTCFTVPEGYFDALPSSILSLIKERNETQNELEEIAPLLNTISKQAVYSVPEGYFESLNLNRPSGEQKTTARVLSLKTARRWMQYAAAAVMAGVLVTGAFMFTDNSKNSLEYEQYRQVDIPTELNKVSEEELLKYLGNNQEHVLLTPTEAFSINEEELMDEKTNMNNLSDEELTQYLKENGDPLNQPAKEKE